MQQEAAAGRVLALDGGSSSIKFAVYGLGAVRDGHSLDTTMGFSPAGSLIMGTRPGDPDPGVTNYLLHNEKLTAPQLNHLLNHEASLLGASETTSDMQALLAAQATGIRAAEAVSLFCLLGPQGCRGVCWHAWRARYAGVCRRHRRARSQGAGAHLPGAGVSGN